MEGKTFDEADLVPHATYDKKNLYPDDENNTNGGGGFSTDALTLL